MRLAVVPVSRHGQRRMQMRISQPPSFSPPLAFPTPGTGPPDGSTARTAPLTPDVPRSRRQTLSLIATDPPPARHVSGASDDFGFLRKCEISERKFLESLVA
jgi:hypothetical protein